MTKLNSVALHTYAKALAGDRKGVTAIEYGLIAGLIAVAIIVAVTAVGGNLTNLFTNISTKIAGA
ncbi:MAG: Flp family type IVb pilin [Alphaproteobacteria bacterium]|nr:Flp family type IVb pilin [Alphaproteobacteria bacterium]